MPPKVENKNTFTNKPKLYLKRLTEKLLIKNEKEKKKETNTSNSNSNTYKAGIKSELERLKQMKYKR